MMPGLFRKKPVAIEAIQWTGQNLDDVMGFCAGNATYELMARGNSELVISTLEDGEGTAQHVASQGDWIIKGVQGEFYPCKPDIFTATYDAAELATPAPVEAGPTVAEMIEWHGPGDRPHRYSPDLMAGGDDCRHCGHGYDAHVARAQSAPVVPVTPPPASDNGEGGEA